MVVTANPLPLSNAPFRTARQSTPAVEIRIARAKCTREPHYTLSFYSGGLANV